MKTLPVLLLGSAAIALGLVALRAPERVYVAPTPQDVEAHAPAPKTLPSDVPAGCTVRTLDVEGMCCTGCTGKLYAKLRSVPGVVSAAVDFEAGTARAVVTRDTDVGALTSALSLDKYRAQLRP